MQLGDSLERQVIAGNGGRTRQRPSAGDDGPGRNHQCDGANDAETGQPDQTRNERDGRPWPFLAAHVRARTVAASERH